MKELGLLHGLMLKSNLIVTIIIILATGITAWLMGWLNEKEAGGSILPGWLLHGILNFVSAVFTMFSFY
ncbi:MAG TPA: hypothetical protein GXX26_04415 [Clostridiaceae bacterium]|jgi:hypothetical protein|nr:hypothetical protein [Clostridiaceae bacterium]